MQKVGSNSNNSSGGAQDSKKEERVCPRCKGRKVDPHHFQEDCQRCGGIGKVYGPESNFVPYPFVD